MRRGTKRGLARLAWVSAGLLLLYLASEVIPGFAAFTYRTGGPWLVFLFLVMLGWAVAGFDDRVALPQPGHVLSLRTKRLVLRRVVPADLGPLFAILSDPEVTRHWDTPPHASPEETQAWIDRMEPVDFCDDFIVTLNGRTIGVLGCMRMPLLSFVFAKSAWRQGYAREALAAYRDYIFGQGLPFLCAATAEANQPARALLTGAGFREVGRSSDMWRVHGEHTAAAHYRLNADPANEDMSDPFRPKSPEPANDVEGEPET